MTSIFDALTDLVGSRDVVSKIGSLVGTDAGETQTLIAQAGPALLGGLADKAAEPGGSDVVFNAVRTSEAGVVDNPLGFLDGLAGGADGSLLSRLVPGLGGGSLGKVAGLVLPLLLGLLKRKAGADGLGASGLAALLSREKAGLPRGADGTIAGLGAATAGGIAGAAVGSSVGSSVGSAGDFAGNVSDKAGDVTGNLRDTAGRGEAAGRTEAVGDRGAAAAPEVRTAATRATDVETRRGGGFLKWLVPLLLVGALALGGWWLINRDGDVDVAAPDGVGANVDVDAPEVDAPDVDAPDVDAPDFDAPEVGAHGEAADSAAADGAAAAGAAASDDAESAAGAEADADAAEGAGAGTGVEADSGTLPATGR